MRIKNQRDDIRAHLRRGLSITPIEAMSLYGCYRLAARIFELREEGIPIHTHMLDLGEGRGMATYRIIK